MNLLGRGLACVLFVGSLSCSATSPAAASRPAPGPMPQGARWRGVYQGPYHIVLNVWTRGARATGNWRAVGDRRGEFSGSVRGNLLVLDWTEHAIAGSETWSGRGYFVYEKRAPARPDQIFGEWGTGPAGPANAWWAVKRADDPLGSESGQVDTDADQQYQDDSTSCDVGNCDNDTGL